MQDIVHLGEQDQVVPLNLSVALLQHQLLLRVAVHVGQAASARGARVDVAPCAAQGAQVRIVARPVKLLSDNVVRGAEHAPFVVRHGAVERRAQQGCEHTGERYATTQAG